MQPEAPVRGLEALGTATRAERRLAAAVTPLLPRVFMEGERIIAATEAVQLVTWRSRRVFGFTWPFVHRVALVFTDRRLLEIALKPAGRRPTGCVWEYAWSTSPYPRADRRTLTLGENRRWLLRWPLPPRVRNEVVEHSKTGTQPLRRAGKARAWRLCPQCGVTAVSPGARCSRCGALNHSRRLATALAIAFPGAGMAYLGRPGYAFFRWVVEVAGAAAATLLLLRADGLPSILALAAAAAAVLLLLKGESVHMTRVLATRTGPVAANAARRWSRFLPLGALLSVTALVLPVIHAGSAATTITSRLRDAARHDGWSQAAASPATDAEPRPIVWQHEEGWQVQASAAPFEPFERPGAVRARWTRQQQQAGATTVEELTLGVHRVVRSVSAGEDGTTALRYLLLDEPGRDAHTLTTTVSAEQTEAADEVLRRLITTLYWSAATPAESLVRVGPSPPPR